jgi:beta-N-acetylhexosaminidase
MVKSLILGVAGAELTPFENQLIRTHDPLGMILFGRNCIDRDQIAKLTASFRALVGRDDAPVLIDQEGGRVQRIKPPMAPKYPSGKFYDALYQLSSVEAVEAAELGGFLIGCDLNALGIDVDCCPVADVRRNSTHDVIGDRALGYNAKQVGVLAGAQAAGLLRAGVMPIVKHCPGHGHSQCDSHHDLPVVGEATFDELKQTDFKPFADLNHLPAFMTAHLLYLALDQDAPATTSRPIIQNIIRQEIGFAGLLFSDDISMNALSGDISQRTTAAFAAGCDIVLHCNGVSSEMEQALGATPVLAGESLTRANIALPSRYSSTETATAGNTERFQTLMARVGFEFTMSASS